jgi:hypothetical protein
MTTDSQLLQKYCQGLAKSPPICLAALRYTDVDIVSLPHILPGSIIPNIQHY